MNDERFQSTLEGSAGPMVPWCDRGSANPPLSNHNSGVGADLHGSRLEIDAHQPGRIPLSAAGDYNHEVTVSNDKCAHVLLNQGGVHPNSVPNFSQHTDNRPASGPVREGSPKGLYTRRSVSVMTLEPPSSTKLFRPVSGTTGQAMPAKGRDSLIHSRVWTVPTLMMIIMSMEIVD